MHIDRAQERGQRVHVVCIPEDRRYLGHPLQAQPEVSQTLEPGACVERGQRIAVAQHEGDHHRAEEDGPQARSKVRIQRHDSDAPLKEQQLLEEDTVEVVDGRSGHDLWRWRRRGWQNAQ